MSTTVSLDLEAANAALAPMGPRERLAWAAETFGDSLAMLASMQKTASVLMHEFYSLGLQQEVLFVDTGFHFRETLRIRDEVMRRYRLNLVTLYPDHTPEQQETKFARKLHLFVDGQPECCRMRKEEPFLNHVRTTGKKLIVNGLRLAEGGKRKKMSPILPDPRIDGYVLHPILEWSDEQVDSYVRENQVPVHPLHAQSFPSIGCECCTTAVEPGEDARAGRWRHLRAPEDSQPMYCGINFTDGSGI